MGSRSDAWEVFRSVSLRLLACPRRYAAADSDLAALVEQKMAADPMHQAMTAQFMSNLLQTQHNGNMAMLYNMGGSGWTYAPRW